MQDSYTGALRVNLNRNRFERSTSVDIIRVSAGVTVTVESKQQTWTKQSLPQRYLCVGRPIKSDQAIRSLCLKGHVRARGSTLWQHSWQEAKWILLYYIYIYISSVLKHLFLERVEQPKKSPKNPRNAFSDALLKSCFQNFAADAEKRVFFWGVSPKKGFPLSLAKGQVNWGGCAKQLWKVCQVTGQENKSNAVLRSGTGSWVLSG